MNTARNTKRSMFTSVLAMLLCFAMLLGTTFAWFTDSVTSEGNKIESGNLKIDLLHKVDESWISVKDNPDHKIFNYDNWEPGYTTVETLKVENLGSLALQYKLSLTVEADSAVLGDNGENLADVIEVYVTYGERTAASFADIKASDLWSYRGTLSEVLTDPATFLGGYIVPADQELTETITTTVGEQNLMIALHMQESAANEYQELSVGNIYVKLVATQWGYESDSFGADYDEGAVFPELHVGGINIPVTNNNGRTAEEVTAAGTGMRATIPAGVALKSNTSVLNVSVEEMEDTQTNITLNEGEALRSLDVHVDGIADDNTVPVFVTVENALSKGLNIGNYTLYHVEDGVSNEMTAVATLDELDEHNEFCYDPATGDVTLAMATFSEVAFLAEPAKWEGEFDYKWYDASKTEFTISNADQLAAFGAIVGGMAKMSDNGEIYTSEGVDGATVVRDSFAGKTVKLIADIRIGDVATKEDPDPSENGIVFYPIGYWNSEECYARYANVADRTALESGFYVFEGTFDGNGHTISDWHHNTWEMKGDHNWYNNVTEQYYRDGMGLFGKVYKGTVKNLTVKNFTSDGEITTTGCIAAYADGATFENIAIFDCNPRVYNIGNGGIVGCVGWYAQEANLTTTFKNITVDNSNKISALWGSYDVPCGGIVGQYYPTSGQTSAGEPANGGMYLENCHVAAVMDVNNDVCGNYQYYAYRYAGILIGSVRENVTIDGREYPNMDGITAKDCTVHFGTWNDYYYCEFEKNGHPSYSGPDDYKFSRISHSEINFTDTNGNGIIDTEAERDSVTGCKHDHTAAEDNQCVYLPFNNLVTGYGWGVTTKSVGDMDGVTILDRVVADSVVKFEGKVNALTNNRVYTLDEIFTLLDTDVELVPGALTVTVTKLDENDNVSESISDNSENWANRTIAFTGTGTVKITIQDYYFCTPTEIEVTVTERQQAEKFEAKVENNSTVGNNGVHVTLASLFQIKDGEKASKVKIEVVAKTGTAEGTYYSEDVFATGYITFSGTGYVTIRIKDAEDSYCTFTELTLYVMDAAQKLAQDLDLVIDVPYAIAAPVIDGKVSEGEYTQKRTTAIGDLFRDTQHANITLEGDSVTEYFSHDADYIYYACSYTRTATNLAFWPRFKIDNSYDVFNSNHNGKIDVQFRLSESPHVYVNGPKNDPNDPENTHFAGTYGGYAAPNVDHRVVSTPYVNAQVYAQAARVGNVETFEVRIDKAYIATQKGIEKSDINVLPYYTYFHEDYAIANTISADERAKITAAGFDVSGVGVCSYYFMNFLPAESMGQITNVIGLNQGVNKVTGNSPVVDGTINSGEYTSTKTTTLAQLGNTTEIKSDLIEYFAHDDQFIYYAAQFTQEADDRAFWFQFKVNNTLDIYKAGYYERIDAQLRYKPNGESYILGGGVNTNCSTRAPELNNEFFWTATKDAQNVKTYELKISKAYLAEVNRCAVADINAMAYFISFHSVASTQVTLSEEDKQLLTNAGAKYLPEDNQSYNFMVFN